MENEKSEAGRRRKIAKQVRAARKAQKVRKAVETEGVGSGRRQKSRSTRSRCLAWQGQRREARRHGEVATRAKKGGKEKASPVWGAARQAKEVAKEKLARRKRRG